MSIFELSEYQKRIQKLQQLLKKSKIALAVFNQNADLFYYTGSIQPLYLFIPASGEPVAASRKAADRIKEEAGFIRSEIFYNTKDLSDILKNLQVDNAEKIGFTLDTTSYLTVNRIQQYYPGSKIADLSLDSRFLRSVKSPAEIDYMRKAGEIIKRIPEQVMNRYKPGMTELEVSAVIENYLRLNGDGGIHNRQESVRLEAGLCSSGANSLSGSKFDGICGGKGISPANPYGASTDRIEKNIPVIIDYAYSFNGYHVDQTRMFSWGKPPSEVLRAYEAMLKVEETVCENMKPGETWTSVYEKSLQKAEELGYADSFMGTGAERVRFVGHGVGLELDEPPFLAPKMEFPLETGMVIAVEPKVALPGKGVIGIENTYIVGENGIENITACPDDWIVFE